MRYLLSVLLLCGALVAGGNAVVSYKAPVQGGTFYLNGLAYQYQAGTDYTVVAAAHSVLNGKFLGLKLRVLNAGEQPVTFQPQDVLVETADGRTLSLLAPAELSRRMNRPYNWARLGVNPGTALPEETSMFDRLMMLYHPAQVMPAHPDGFLAAPQFVSAGMAPDTTGADAYVGVTPRLETCGPVCLLLHRENLQPDLLSQLQREVSPETVEKNALLANTVLPRTDVVGVLYYPMPKALPSGGKKVRVVHVTVPIGGEVFQFVFAVE